MEAVGTGEQEERPRGRQVQAHEAGTENPIETHRWAKRAKGPE